MDTKQTLLQLEAKQNSLQQFLNDRKARKECLATELETVMKSQVLLQAVAGEVQSQLSLKINSIVNLGLQCCFPEYTFELRYVPMRGKTEVQFVVKDGDTEIDVLNQNGGGVVDILCMSLRIAVFAISNVNNVIILDEPYRFVSKELRPKVAQLLSVLCEKLGLQIIMVTHISELAESADNKFIIKKINGISEVLS